MLQGGSLASWPLSGIVACFRVRHVVSDLMLDHDSCAGDGVWCCSGVPYLLVIRCAWRCRAASWRAWSYAMANGGAWAAENADGSGADHRAFFRVAPER